VCVCLCLVYEYACCKCMMDDWDFVFDLCVKMGDNYFLVINGIISP
jgi:hypothetical protein